LVELDHRLKGEIKDPETGRWIPLTETGITDKCRNNFLSFLNALINQNTTLSTLSPPEINNIMANVIEYVRDDLEENAENYGIGGKFTEMTRIGDMMIILTFLTVKRAINGMESKRIFDSLMIGEKLSYMPQQQDKGGFWKKFKVW